MLTVDTHCRLLHAAGTAASGNRLLRFGGARNSEGSYEVTSDALLLTVGAAEQDSVESNAADVEEPLLSFRSRCGFCGLPGTKETTIYRDGEAVWRRKGKVEQPEVKFRLEPEEVALMETVLNRIEFTSLPTVIQPTPNCSVSDGVTVGATHDDHTVREPPSCSTDRDFRTLNPTLAPIARLIDHHLREHVYPSIDLR